MNSFRRLLILFVAVVAVKILLSSFVPSPSMFADEYVYAKQAQGIADNSGLLVHGLAPAYPFVYSSVMSLAYKLADDMEIVYFFMKCINAILSTLMIIPVWLLARLFLDEKKSFFAALLAALHPSSFSFSAFIMAENLFYPLFLMSVYLIYKSLNSKNIFMPIIAGISIAVIVFVKYSGLILLICPIALYLINSYFSKSLFDFKRIRQMAIIYLAAFLVALVFLQIDPALGLSSLMSPAGDATAVLRHDNYIPSFINWLFIYSGFALLGCGVIFGVLGAIALYEKDDNKRKFILFAWSIILIFVFISANHSAGGPVAYGPFKWFTERPLGRYMDTIAPLLLILGFMGLETFASQGRKKLLNRCLIGSAAVLALASQLNFAALLPVNNLSLTHFGLLKMALEKIINNGSPEFSWMIFLLIAPLFILPPFLFIILNNKNKINLKNLVWGMGIYFLVISFLCYGVTAVNASQYWYSGEQMALGRWIDDSLDSSIPIVIDEGACTQVILKSNQEGLCDVTHLFSPLGFFVRNAISIDYIENIKDNSYFVTTAPLPDARLITASAHYYVYKLDGRA